MRIKIDMDSDPEGYGKRVRVWIVLAIITPLILGEAILIALIVYSLLTLDKG